MNNLKSRKPQVDDAYDVGIGTQFSAETNKRDEDEEMMKYVYLDIYSMMLDLPIFISNLISNSCLSPPPPPDTSKSNWINGKIRN